MVLPRSRFTMEELPPFTLCSSRGMDVVGCSRTFPQEGDHGRHDAGHAGHQSGTARRAAGSGMEGMAEGMTEAMNEAMKKAWQEGRW